MNFRHLLFLFLIISSTFVFPAGGVLPGAGTAVNPYKVEDYADLKKVGINATYSKAKVYQIVNNIDASLSATENGGLGFVPIGTSAAPFTGKFYGNGKTISNLVINRTTNYIGLFGYLNSNALVDKVAMVDCYIKGNLYVGAVAGYCKNSTVKNSYNTDSVISTNRNAGGIVGYGLGAIIDSCWNEGAVITTNLYAGGITSYNDAGTISNSYNKGSITAVESAAGIVGYTINATPLSNCYNEGAIFASTKQAGGIVAYCTGGSITNSYNEGSVSTPESSGGIVGITASGTTISDCYNKGNISASTKQAGGIAGRTGSGTITSCFNYGAISGYSYIGGLIGYANSIISGCYNVADIQGDYSYVGGLIGSIDNGTITTSYSTGACTGASLVGGFAGNIKGSDIKNVYTTGDVVGTIASIGGFVGQTYSATLDTCYSVGLFSGAKWSGGFIGSNYNGIFLNSYFNNETTGTTIDIGNPLTSAPPIPGLTIAEMKNSSIINTLDYTTIWDIRNDSIYPALRNIDNAPFAFNDTIKVSASAITEEIDFSACMENDFDYETLQDSLVYRFKSISNGTTDSISKIYFLPSPQNGDTITLLYRIGEKNSTKPDTLWGNTAKVIVIMDDIIPSFAVTTLITNEDSVTIFDLNATDIDNDSITIAIIDSAIYASIVLIKDSIVYSPDANFFGSDSLRLLISDGLLQDSIWINITVLPINDAPVARDTLITWIAGLPFSMQLPISDVDNAVFTAYTYVLPTNGSATMSADSVNYLSDPYYTGNDTIRWYALDTGGLSSDTVSLIVTLLGPTLAVSHDSLNFQSPGGVADYVTVTSNTLWTAISSESWVSVIPTSNIGDDSLYIVVDENLVSIGREAIITITAPGAVPQILKITQEKKVFITISPLTGTFESCNGTPILLNYTKQLGSPTQYRILYSAEALAAGFTDTGYTNLIGGSSGTINIDIPLPAPFGSYTANLQFRNALGIESDLYPFTCYKNLPESYIINNPTTVLTIDNQSYNFVAYQWYKDDIPLPNETKSSYSDMEGFDGYYQAKLWTSDGDSLLTCEKYIYTYEISHKIARVYPNPVRQHESFTIEFSDPISNAFNEVDIRIYDASGKLAYTTKSGGGKTVITYNKQPGIYVIHLALDIGEDYVFYLIVTE